MKTQDEIIKILDDETQDLKETLAIESKWLSMHPDSLTTRRIVDNLTCTLKRVEIIKFRILAAPIITTKEAITKADTLLTQCNEQIDSIDQTLFGNGLEIDLASDKNLTKFKEQKTQ